VKKPGRVKGLFRHHLLLPVPFADGVFGRRVSEEFLALYQAGVFTALGLEEIRLNGLRDDLWFGRSRVPSLIGLQRAPTTL
jgi:hypothetical protein